MHSEEMWKEGWQLRVIHQEGKRGEEMWDKIPQWKLSEAFGSGSSTCGVMSD